MKKLSTRPSLFFGFVSITFASIFFAERQSRYIHLSGASATFAYFTQPGVIGFLVGCLGVFGLYGLFDHRQIKHVAASVALSAGLVVGFSTFQNWALREDGSTLQPVQIGRRLFFDEYLEASRYAAFSGPAADELKHALDEFFGSPSYSANLLPYVKEILKREDDNWEKNYKDLFGQYDGRPRDLVDRMFSQPNRDYFQAMFIIPDLTNGVPDRLFLRAALAYLYLHPIIVADFMWHHLIDFAAGLPWYCDGHEVFPDCRSPEDTTFYPAMQRDAGIELRPGVMPDDVYLFLTAREVSRMAAADGIWQWFYDNLRVPLLASMLFGGIASFWATRQLRWTMATIIAAYAANLLVFSLFEEPQFRYQMVGISTCAFAAGPGLFLTLLWASRAALARLKPLGSPRVFGFLKEAEV